MRIHTQSPRWRIRIHVYARWRVLSLILNVCKYISVRLLLINMCAHYVYKSV